MIDQAKMYGAPPLSHSEIVRSFGAERAVTGEEFTVIQPPDNDGTKDEVIVTFGSIIDHEGGDPYVMAASYRHGGETLIFDLDSMSRSTALGLLRVFVRQEGYRP